MKGNNIYMREWGFIVALVFVLLGVCAAAGMFIHNKNGKLMKQLKVDIQITTHRADSLNVVSDSLTEVIRVMNIELGRYEVALSTLKETNPDAVAEFEQILSTKTE